MQDIPGSRPSGSVVPWIISATVACYVLQFVFMRLLHAGGLLESMLGLSQPNVAAWKLWTLVTYGLLHDTNNLLHIIANLLGLYFLGRALEPMLGSQRFTWLYAGCIFLGGLLWYGTHWQGGGGWVVGASAGVAGLFTVYACFAPNQPITLLLFFVLPVSIKPRHALFALLGIELLGFLFYEIMGAISPFSSPVAHSAHLGGMAAGWIYYRYLHERPDRTGKPGIQMPGWLRKKPAASTYRVNIGASTENLRAEVDRILDKINSRGFGSLTAEEKRVLDQAKDILAKRG